MCKDEEINYMNEQIEYKYKLYRDDDELVVTVDPLVNDIEQSIRAMMNMNIDELSFENQQIFEMKILGLRTIHQFLGALQQEQYLKEYKAGLTTELKGQINIDVDRVVDSITKGALH
jgi:hypothetical protein